MDSSIKNLINKRGLTRVQKLMLTMSVENKPMSVAAIRAMASKLGVREIKRWNVSSILGANSSWAIRTGDGWELSDEGKVEVEKLKGSSAAITATVSSVRTHLNKIKQSDTREFLEEAIVCFEHRHFRAATVLAWVGAIDLLYDFVVRNHLSAFNSEAQRRSGKWKAAKTKDDLALMGEHEFLNVIEAISIIGNNVKQELQTVCLKLRNACGHPNSFKVAENRVAGHLDSLVLNVFARFS